MMHLYDTIRKHFKRSRWKKAVRGSKHDLAHELPISFWSQPDEDWVDFFIKKNGNPIANIYRKRERWFPGYMNPIHEVARNNPNPNVLRKILKYAIDFDLFETKFGQLPLGYSMINSRKETSRPFYPENAHVLLDIGTDLKRVYLEFNSCCLHAVATAPDQYGFVLDECLRHDNLLELPFGGRIVPNQTPLAIAAGSGRFWACEKLIKAGADIEGLAGNLSPLTCCVSSLTDSSSDQNYYHDVYTCLVLLLKSGARCEVKFQGISRTKNEWVNNIVDPSLKTKVSELLL